jgi:hypothetical protein
VRAVIESRGAPGEWSPRGEGPRGGAGSLTDQASVAVTILVPGTRAPLVAALTGSATRRLGLGPGSSIFLVWKTHSCRAVPAGAAPLKESA